MEFRVHSGWSLLWMELIPDGVHFGWSSLWIEYTLDVHSGWSSLRVETFCLFFNYSHFAPLSTRTTGVPSEGGFCQAVFISDGVHSRWSSFRMEFRLGGVFLSVL